MFDHFNLPQPDILFLLAGVLCLLAGRRALGLLIALTGFYLGGRLAKIYWGADSSFFIFLFATFSALAGVVLSKISKTAAINIAAFAIGGFVFSSFLVEWSMAAPQYEGVLFIIFGLLSAAVATFMFEFALVAFSAILGAALLAQISGSDKLLQMSLFTGLALAGIVIQIGIFGKRSGRSRRAAGRL